MDATISPRRNRKFHGEQTYGTPLAFATARQDCRNSRIYTITRPAAATGGGDRPRLRRRSLKYEQN